MTAAVAVLERRRALAFYGEAFSLYNAANLSGHSGILTSAAFGRPAARSTQVFASGGPRAFQFGARRSGATCAHAGRSRRSPIT